MEHEQYMMQCLDEKIDRLLEEVALAREARERLCSGGGTVAKLKSPAAPKAKSTRKPKAPPAPGQPAKRRGRPPKPETKPRRSPDGVDLSQLDPDDPDRLILEDDDD